MIFPCPEFVKKLIEYLERFFSKLDHTHPDLSPADHDHNSDYAPLDHNHDADYAPLDHDHDDRYYTETETDTLLDDKADVGHTHQGGAIVGEIRMWASGGIPPSGWLECDGTELAVSQYPALYAVIGETYGSSDPGNFFRIPDFRAVVPVGVSLDHGVDYFIGGSGGEREHTLTVAEMPSHRHPISRSGSMNLPSGSSFGWPGGVWNNPQSFGEYTDYSGGGNPHNNMPPYLAVQFIIYAGA